MSNIGTNIATIRKTKKITQDQLAAYVNVSPQAVSKWENGGMPDCELLPQIADYLQVSIDALFGREMENSNDVKRALAKKIADVPRDERFDPVMDFVWTMQCALTDDTRQRNSYAEILKARDGQNSYSQMIFDGGLSLMSLIKERPYFMCMPEPADGWLKSLAKPEEYCRLFAFLSEKDFFDALLLLYRIEPFLFTAGLLQSELQMSPPRIDEFLVLLEQNKMITKANIQTESGADHVYHFHANPAFVGVLLLAIEMIDPPCNYLNYNNSRKRRNFLQSGT